MINYSDNAGNELRTEIQRVDMKMYRQRISFKSKNTIMNKEDLKLHANFLTKDNTVRNREMILSEGMNSLMVYVHQIDSNDGYSNDVSYIDLSYCTNSNPTGKHYSTSCGKLQMTNETIKTVLENLIRKESIPVNSEYLSELLKVPSNFSENVSETESEKIFNHYKNIVSKVVEQIRKIDTNMQSKSIDDDEER